MLFGSRGVDSTGTPLVLLAEVNTFGTQAVPSLERVVGTRIAHQSRS